MKLKFQMIKMIKKYFNNLIFINSGELNKKRDSGINIHDRIFMNDHTLITWGIGVDVLNPRINFRQKKARVKFSSTFNLYSIFNPEFKTTRKKKGAWYYSLMRGFAKDFKEILDLQ
jgi:hypothetical protein